MRRHSSIESSRSSTPDIIEIENSIFPQYARLDCKFHFNCLTIFFPPLLHRILDIRCRVLWHMDSFRRDVLDIIHFKLVRYITRSLYSHQGSPEVIWQITESFSHPPTLPQSCPVGESVPRSSYRNLSSFILWDTSRDMWNFHILHSLLGDFSMSQRDCCPSLYIISHLTKLPSSSSKGKHFSRSALKRA